MHVCTAGTPTSRPHLLGSSKPCSVPPMYQGPRSHASIFTPAVRSKRAGHALGCRTAAAAVLAPGPTPGPRRLPHEQASEAQRWHTCMPHAPSWHASCMHAARPRLPGCSSELVPYASRASRTLLGAHRLSTSSSPSAWPLCSSSTCTHTQGALNGSVSWHTKCKNSVHEKHALGDDDGASVLQQHLRACAWWRRLHAAQRSVACVAQQKERARTRTRIRKATVHPHACAPRLQRHACPRPTLLPSLIVGSCVSSTTGSPNSRLLPGSLRTRACARGGAYTHRQARRPSQTAHEHANRTTRAQGCQLGATMRQHTSRPCAVVCLGP